MIDGTFMAGVHPSTTRPKERQKSKRAQTERIEPSIDSISVTTMAAVTPLTINEWVKELDEFR